MNGGAASAGPSLHAVNTEISERGDGERALDAFGGLHARYPEDGPTRVYLQRCLQSAGEAGPRPAALAEASFAMALQ